MGKKLYRDKKNEKVAGVCAGLAEYFKIDVTIIRLIWVLFVLFAGSGVLAYIACALVIPEKPDDYVTVE
jgi:phage shock protein C